MGVDPGYDRLGIAVIEKERGNESLLYSDCIQTKSSDSFAERLHCAGSELEALLKTYKPEHVAVESVFFTNNQKTAMDVAATRGVVIYTAQKHACEIFEYTPPQIKLAVAGSGRGTKKDITAMIHHLITFDKKNALDDEYDAIAVALTHSAIHK